jgi:hypothetical protein
VRYFIIIAVILFSLSSQAQDSLRHKADSVIKAKEKLLHPPDTVTHALDSVNAKAAKLKSQFKTPALPDSLNPVKKANSVSGQVNSKLNAMTRVDSLFLKDRHLRQVDSLKLAFQAKSRSLQEKATGKPKKVKKSLDSLQRSYDKRISDLTTKFKEKNKDLLNGHEKELNEKLNLKTPAFSQRFPSLDFSKIPGTNTSLPSLPAAGAGLNLPNTTVPGTGNVNLPNTSVPGMGNVNLPSNPLNQALPTKEINQESAELKKWEKEGTSYVKQAKDLKADSATVQKAAHWTEDQIQGRTPIKALKDKELEMQKQEKLRQEYLKKVAEYQSPKKAEEEIKKNLDKVANADLLKNQKGLQAAQKDLTAAKKKYGEFESMKNLPKRPLNPMSELPFRERIVPGLFIQVTNNKYYSIDLAPQLYYKITTRFDVGSGLIYRVNVDFNKATFVHNRGLYGFKVFADFKIYKTFYFRAEGERVNREIPLAVNSDLTNFRWTNTLMGGIGKEFNFSKKIQGNSVVLYNVLDKYDSPYASKILFRFGFNLSLKKDQRKEFIKGLK